MRLRKDILGLSLALVILFSVASLLQQQRNIDSTFGANTQVPSLRKLNINDIHQTINYPVQHYDLLTFWTAGISQGTVAEKTPLPENCTRTEIYNFISDNPGVQFRAICSGLGLSIGVVQFHLVQLQKNGLITSIRKGRYKRFFAAHKFTRSEIETIAMVKLNTVRNILKALLEGKRVSHHELAVRLSISSQGLTWQMKRLRESGLIQEDRGSLSVTYTIGQTYIPLVTHAMAIIENS
jgi:predicted transcriptional regulator